MVIESPGLSKGFWAWLLALSFGNRHVKLYESKTPAHTLDKKLIHHRISWELNPIHANPNKTKKTESSTKSSSEIP